MNLWPHKLSLSLAFPVSSSSGLAENWNLIDFDIATFLFCSLTVSLSYGLSLGVLSSLWILEGVQAS